MDEKDSRILVVDDEQDLCEILKFNLETEGYQVETANSAEEALEKDIASYNLLLLDVMMGGMSGFQLAKQLKNSEVTAHIPIIFLTARDTENDTVTGFNLGADDYIPKPFRPRELLSRIKNVLRLTGSAGKTVKLGDVVVDTEKGTAMKNNKDLFLSALEYRLLLAFINNRGIVLTRERLLDSMWDVAGTYVNDNTLTVYIKRLREKIEDDPAEPKIIQTVRGIGYKVDA